MWLAMTRLSLIALALGSLLTAACGAGSESADLLLINGRVYTFSWPEPDREGRPVSGAPHDAAGWRPDAQAIAIRGDRILFVGERVNAESYRGPSTRVVDLGGATVLPGLIDSHVHLPELGASLERVNLVGVRTEAEAVARVEERARTAPKGEWIVGWGWDEGAWANRYPDMRLLSERVPDHPVILRGLHTFAVWGNRLAFERAKITAATPAPTGGEIRKDRRGQPTGILLNTAGTLLMNALPPATPDQLEARIVKGLEALAAAGYVSVHETGADEATLAALEQLHASGQLAMPVYTMLAARDASLMKTWVSRRPVTDPSQLVIRSVKAFYDGAMGSRGALFFEDYSDRRGHRGVGGAGYGFDRDRMAAMMRAGFQVVIHAIGDRANREALDFFQSVIASNPDAKNTRPRIEHAQVVNAADLPRFAALGVTASMQPSHAVEDMPWAEARIGPDRIKGAYAWRSLRRAGARLALNSDLPATDYNIFYGLHSSVTRTDKEGQPPGGWRKEEALTIEEALRGWTTWAAYAEFREHETGTLVSGRRADITVVDIDPMQLGEKDPSKLLGGRVVMTVAGGKVLYDSKKQLEPLSASPQHHPMRRFLLDAPLRVDQRKIHIIRKHLQQAPVEGAFRLPRLPRHIRHDRPIPVRDVENLAVRRAIGGDRPRTPAPFDRRKVEDTDQRMRKRPCVHAAPPPAAPVGALARRQLLDGSRETRFVQRLPLGQRSRGIALLRRRDRPPGRIDGGRGALARQHAVPAGDHLARTLDRRL
jgi:predicted amidohydrolase YtcJ